MAHYPEAVSEFEKCRERRGEATAVFLDDLPTVHYYATLPYWLGRAREMQKLDARSQFQEFLRIRQGATGDPLSRTRGAGSNPPRANLSSGSPPAPNDWRAVRFRRLPSPSPTRRQS